MSEFSVYDFSMIDYYCGKDFFSIASYIHVYDTILIIE